MNEVIVMKFEYKNPTVIKFNKAMRVKLRDFDRTIEKYKPFYCSSAWAVEKFEYGDFDNWVTAVIESVLIDAKYSQYYEKDAGIFKAGETKWSLVQRFWYFRKNEAFWNKMPTIGYPGGSSHHSKTIDDIYVNIDSIFVISDEDKRKIEQGEKLEFVELFMDAE